MKKRLWIQPNKAAIFYGELDGQWRAKWRETNCQGTWCGFGQSCKKPHQEKDEAIQCALHRWLTFSTSREMKMVPIK